MAMLALFFHLAVAVAAGESPSLKKGLCIPPGEASIYVSIYRYTGEASIYLYIDILERRVIKKFISLWFSTMFESKEPWLCPYIHIISSLISELISTFLYWDISRLIIYLLKNFHCGDLEAFSRASWCSHNDNFTTRRICVLRNCVYICMRICIVEYLCICVFVYLRNCVFAYVCMCKPSSFFHKSLPGGTIGTPSPTMRRVPTTALALQSVDLNQKAPLLYRWYGATMWVKLSATEAPFLSLAFSSNNLFFVPHDDWGNDYIIFELDLRLSLSFPEQPIMAWWYNRSCCWQVSSLSNLR